MTRSIDLNSDLGESFGRWSLGDDAAMFALVTSASIACGFHAGTPSIMLASCRMAAKRGVAIGAHVSYPDLAGFGRRTMDIDPDELYADVLHQLAALDGIARVAGSAVRYVKPHGALYNRIAVDGEQAEAVVRAVRDYDESLPILGLAGSVVAGVAAGHGLAFRREAFVDRAYSADGTLAPRGTPGAVLTDAVEAAVRAVAMVTGGTVRAVDGSEIALEFDSLCVHGDTPGALAMAHDVREALATAGVTFLAFA
ncbi:LamB/YcsF family protein [Luethyella okanaganae]|uniref:5-oxoprolinase subunit A n=1 Tax=Luethyella okanaganae TaxID=69372 RepID=A0ABW1VGY9_9MICO